MKLLPILFLFIANGVYGQYISDVYFSEAQPKGVKEITSFDASILGEYKKEDNPYVTLIVDSTRIQLEYLTRMYLLMKDISTSTEYSIKGDKLYGVDSSKGIEYIVVNDTAFFGILQTETFFEMSENNITKKIGEQYIINEELDDDLWGIMLLYVKENTLYLRFIDPEKDKEKINQNFDFVEVNKFNSEPIYYISPEGSSFEKFVEVKGFYEILKYQKITREK